MLDSSEHHLMKVVIDLRPPRPAWQTRHFSPPTNVKNENSEIKFPPSPHYKEGERFLDFPPLLVSTSHHARFALIWFDDLPTHTDHQLSENRIENLGQAKTLQVGVGTSHRRNISAGRFSTSRRQHGEKHFTPEATAMWWGHAKIKSHYPQT